MKDEYDFTNAEQGKFYVPVEEIEMPIYLDKDISEFLRQNQKNLNNLQTLVNDLLRKDIEIAQRFSQVNYVSFLTLDSSYRNLTFIAVSSVLWKVHKLSISQWELAKKS